MSEKRFYYLIHNLNEDDEYYEIIDKAQRYSFNFVKDEWLATQVCTCLNEQQNTINKQNELIKLIADACTYSKEHSVKEILRNDAHMSIGYICKKVEKKLNEQQATIRRLQDLCGESDSENAKLRIENEKLRKELSDCEKFRYTVFKRLNDEYIKECSIK